MASAKKTGRSDLRGEMRRILLNLDSRWLSAASTKLCAELDKIFSEKLDFEINHILAWTSFFPGEPDLGAFISNHLEKCEVYLPRALEDGSMKFVSIGRDWAEAMEQGPFGIPSPADSSGRLYDPSFVNSTAVLTPGLTFDRMGNRIGRGKGYYDRFLAQAPMRNSIKIGICWSLQVVDVLPALSHDVPMDWVCHERGSYRAGEAP